MAEIFQVNVYKINDGQPLRNPELTGFSFENIKIKPAPENSLSFSGQPLYSIIEELPRGLNLYGLDNYTSYYTIETVEELYGLATSICFAYDGELSGNAIYSSNAEFGLINGKPYYKAKSAEGSDLILNGVDYYIWYSTSGDYANKWVFAPLNNATLLTTGSYLSTSSSSINPIGIWTIVENEVGLKIYIGASDTKCDKFAEAVGV